MASLAHPSVGFGTLLLQESCEVSVGDALQLGCTLVDTGEHYGNLEKVGAALQKCSAKPFVVMKLSGMPVGEYELVRARVEAMLKQLGISKADVCLMHWPGLCTWDPTDHNPLASPADFADKGTSWEDFCNNISIAWENMTKLKADGLIAEIGTSNFYPHHLAEVSARCAGAQPFANEIFIDSTNQELQFVADMQSKGIHVFAYRPVIYKPFHDAVTKVASRHSDVAPQAVVLAWLLKRGIFPIVKCRGAHIKDNLTTPAALRDQLTEEDMLAIKEADTGGLRYSAEWFAKIWKMHNETTAVSEEDVQMLVAMGIDEEKARAALEASGGNLDAAMDAALG